MRPVENGGAMNRRPMSAAACLALALALAWPAVGATQDLKPIQLAPPQMEGGKPLMQALKERATARAFSPEKLPDQVLSNLLWAAFGVNRPDGRRTAPSASNWQEVDIYVMAANGAFVYEAKTHSLTPVASEDLRALAGTQAFAKEAPVTLVFVADYARMGKATQERKDFLAPADTGYISQNVYLFCASEGLATGVRVGIDQPAVAKALKLRPDQKIILAQSVGYPKK
jgi:SagB-type dehydrogenase family enzyme